MDETPAMPPWGPAELSALRQRLTANSSSPWDLVVVGAGISGAGVARDAAMRGLRVLVLDAEDLAFGTSSRSSRLIHGGVRYLEQGEVGLVYEGLRERARLYASAPHLVRPARFLFPAYTGDRLGPVKLRLGLTLYDTLNFHRGTGHEYLTPEQVAAEEPLVRTEGLRGAVRYEDAVTDDARLTLTVLQDARRHGADVLTYAPVQRIDGGVEHATVVLHGGATVSARQVVVAAGPWTGAALIGRPGEGLLTLSKGVHLVMRHDDVPVRQPVVVQAPGQRRILFVVPWGSRTYLGTTDTAYEGDPGRSGVTEADEREVLEIVGRLLPGAALRPERVVGAWSGVRPLVAASESPGEATEEISRRHRVVPAGERVVALVGGKLTTYRAMAEDAVDGVVRRLAGAAGPVRRCTTDRVPLSPGAPLPIEARRDPLIEDLALRHGPLAPRIVEAARTSRSRTDRIVEDLSYRWCEVDHALQHEGCHHLIDLLRRRLPLALTSPDQGGAVARQIAARVAEAWGEGQSRIDEELDRYREAIRGETRRDVSID